MFARPCTAPVCLVSALVFVACGEDASNELSPSPTTDNNPNQDADAGPPNNDGAPPFGELPVFIQPTRLCVDPLPGQPEGQSPNGEVCTWQAIAGATEEGRSFEDYASCDVVRTQRPYFPMPSHDAYPDGDPRMEDPAYVAELAWAEGQIRATGCACCHSDNAPLGPVRWTIDAPGNWLGTFSDRDVAALSGLIDTSMFGRFAPADNNGFHRVDSVPSTDPDRIRAFFANELAHRGLGPEDFADAPPTGVPLLEQAAYEAGECEDGEGITPQGTLLWSGGPARYLYVMTPQAQNPTIPPNFDLPEGTLWRIDVPSNGVPVLPGDVTYGQLPAGLIQKHPASPSEPPVALISGQTYKLYVTRDVFQPITRCLFRAP